MAKIKFLPNIDEETGLPYHHPSYLYHCPGCGYEHAFALKSEGGYHEFNGDLNNPTVTPSLVQNFTPGRMCHSFITNGQIQFLGDCWHELRNTTVELPDVDFEIEQRLLNLKK